MPKKKAAKKVVKRSAPAKRSASQKSVHPLKRTVHPLTSLTIVFWILIGILFLAIYLTRFA